MKTKILVISIVILLVFSSFSNNAYSHWDNQSDKAYRTRATLEKLSFYEGARTIYDLGSGADFVIGWKAELDGHPDATKSGTFSLEDVPVSDIDDVDIGTVMLDHYECSPAGDFHIHAWAAESDQDNTLDTEKLMNDTVGTGVPSQVKAKQLFESVGDTFIGLGSKQVKADDSLARDEKELRVNIDFEKTFALRVHFIREWVPEFDKECQNQQTKTALALPSWFKNNAKWWKDGQISDQDIILAIENLIQQKIITVKNISAQTSSNTSTKIPKYIKDVFGFWSEDQVSDNEIANSLEFLVGNGIIRSEKISQKQIVSDTKDPLILKKIYEAARYHEFGSRVLLMIKNYESKTLDELSKNAWKDFEKDKQNNDLMQEAQDLDASKKKAQEQALEAITIENAATKTVDAIKDAAKKAGISTQELENEAKEVNEKQESFGVIDSQAALKSAYNTGQLAFQQFDVIQNEISITSQNFDSILIDTEMTGEELFDYINSGKEMLNEGSLVKKETENTKTGIVTVQSNQGHYTVDPLADPCVPAQHPFHITVRWIIKEPIVDGYADFTMTMDNGGNEQPYKVPGTFRPFFKNGVTGDSIVVDVPGTYIFELTEVNGIPITGESKITVVIPPPTCNGPSYTSPPQTEGKTVSTILMGGKYYPLVQFVSAKPDACGKFHYHSPFEYVYAIDGFKTTDPNKKECGFGPVDSTPVIDIVMTQKAIYDFKVLTGLDP